MRISFDLDDTLICYGRDTPCEPLPPWYRRMLASREPLRLGAIALVRALKARGWDVCVYTTSHRRPSSVRRWLGSYGLRVGRIINQDDHDRYVRRDRSTKGRLPSKNPAAFEIDLHVDDSDGVSIEGKRFNFRVVVVAPDDGDWAEKVMASAEDAMRGATRIRP